MYYLKNAYKITLIYYLTFCYNYSLFIFETIKLIIISILKLKNIKNNFLCLL